MAKPSGFMEFPRQDPTKRPVADRLSDYQEIEQPLPPEQITQQAARCMDCGIPSCHTFGCPVTNRIPDWNDMVYRGRWRDALEVLHSTNNFPEITGRICPAPCETACTLSINQPAVTIRHIELQIVERGWQEGWIKPQPAPQKTGKKVAIIGSGPAGLAAAQQLARLGHQVIVFEKFDRIGGILRYGIPDFKLEKWVLDRRVKQLQAEGVSFETQVNAGVDISAGYLQRSYDAIVITAGAWTPRDLKIPGRDLPGIHFAMDFLIQQNRRVAGQHFIPGDEITARYKNVVVIGGGDTGSDCVGTSNRQGAKKVTQIELLPEPPKDRTADNPWPTWPRIMRSSTSHDEGCQRMWSIATKEFVGKNGHLAALRCVKLNWTNTGNAPAFTEIPGSEFELPASLALLSMGFLHVEHGPLVEDLNLERDHRGNLKVDANYMTTTPGVFAAGDSVRGASLIVHAINLGRQAAAAVDEYLMTTAK